jgi:O-acetyl-ADP-ribose deacetylase (regulator of RNase III)
MCIENIACAARRDHNHIALPQLGCGCGGLDWADVWPLYEKHLGGLDCDVEVWIHESH